MSPDWLEELHQAATQLKGQDIAVLIAQIPQEYSGLKQMIKAKVDNFDFDQVADLADTALDTAHHRRAIS